jgi:hypothetical protein
MRSAVQTLNVPDLNTASSSLASGNYPVTGDAVVASIDGVRRVCPIRLKNHIYRVFAEG